MADYPYSPELKKPGKPIDFDLSRPGTLMMLKLLVKTHQKQTAAFTPPEGIRVSRTELANVPCLLVEQEDSGELPVMLYCHGGAFYLPVQVSSLELACMYAKQLQMRIVIPEYRLVPDFPAPAAFEDCLAVWQQLEGYSEKRIIYGESAGGALAAGLALYIRDHGLKKPHGQILIYPVLDNCPEKYPSMTDYADAAWSNRSNASIWEAYLKNAQENYLPYLIPMQAENFRDLPEAYVEPQQIDVLRDDAIAYAQRLTAAAVPTELNLVPGSYHGFDSDLTSPLVQRILKQRISAIRRILIQKEA